MIGLVDTKERIVKLKYYYIIKMSESKKGTKASDETRKKQSEIRLGKKLSPESIAKREATKKINRELIEEEKRMMIF